MSDTSPAPSREALNDRQFGSTASQYVVSPTHAAGADLRQITGIAERLGGARVLDVGCGGGHVSYAVAPHVASVVACDLSHDMLAAVAAEAKRRGLGNITTTQAPAEALPFADASFDAVICRYTTHHWPDVRRGLREMRRVLKPAGIGIVSDTVAPEQPAFDTFLQAFELLRDPSHVRNYTTAEWVEIARQADFKVTGLTRRRLRLAFEPWLARQRTPEVQASAIRALFAAVPQEMRAHFDIGADADFTLDEAVFELAPA